jgi:putative membrane protein
MNLVSKFSILTCSLLASTALTFAADASKATGATVDKGDLKFVTEAVQGSVTEIAVGKLADQKSTNAEIKKVGEMLVKDHGKANAELNEIAKKKGIDVPLVGTRKQTSTVEGLAKKEGEDFDKAFVKELEADHKEDIKVFEKASTEVKDPELRAFAAKQLPVLQEHLMKIQSLKAK